MTRLNLQDSSNLFSSIIIRNKKIFRINIKKILYKREKAYFLQKIFKINKIHYKLTKLDIFKISTIHKKSFNNKM
jgi:hypothetical protein